MSYPNPQQIKSPKGAVTHLRVIYDGGEQIAGHDDWEGWSVAELDWYEEPALACRWNGSTDNDDVSPVGNPQSHRHPTWFLLPKPLEDAIRARLKDAPKPGPAESLASVAAAASIPAFAEIWSNPEDDVYDAL
jgi:hypothetical protein